LRNLKILQVVKKITKKKLNVLVRWAVNFVYILANITLTKMII
jgi:hypothetical protein